MTLKVLQWNCLYSEDTEAVGRLVKESGADIVFLQELTQDYNSQHSDTGAYIAKVLGYDDHVSCGPMVLPNGRPAQVGMGIFSKFPMVDKQKIILQPSAYTDGKITRDERFYLQTSIDIGSNVVGLGTTHLPFHPTFRTTASKQRMVEAISESANKFSHFILGADLNTTPQTKAATTLRHSGLTNAGPALKHATWATKRFSIGAREYNELRWRLDYILTKGNLKTIKSQVLATQLSDHLPIVTELKTVA